MPLNLDVQLGGGGVNHPCTHCGTDAISSWYEPRLDTERQVDHDQWKSVEEVKPIKTKGKKEPVMRKIKALRLVTSNILCKDLHMNLTTDMTLIAGHLFRAAWQQDQFRLSKLNMPPKSAVLVADFQKITPAQWPMRYNHTTGRRCMSPFIL